MTCQMGVLFWGHPVFIQETYNLIQIASHLHQQRLSQEQDDTISTKLFNKHDS